MSKALRSTLTWVEIDARALKNNIKALRSAVGSKVLLAPCVKANAYGHGILEISKLLLKNGADWLCVNSVEEAISLRNSGIPSLFIFWGT